MRTTALQYFRAFLRILYTKAPAYKLGLSFPRDLPCVVRRRLQNNQRFLSFGVFRRFNPSSEKTICLKILSRIVEDVA